MSGYGDITQFWSDYGHCEVYTDVHTEYDADMNEEYEAEETVYNILGGGNGYSVPVIASGTIYKLINDYESGKFELCGSFLAALDHAGEWDLIEELCPEEIEEEQSLDDLINDADSKKEDKEKSGKSINKDDLEK